MISGNEIAGLNLWIKMSSSPVTNTFRSSANIPWFSVSSFHGDHSSNYLVAIIIAFLRDFSHNENIVEPTVPLVVRYVFKIIYIERVVMRFESA